MKEKINSIIVNQCEISEFVYSLMDKISYYKKCEFGNMYFNKIADAYISIVKSFMFNLVKNYIETIIYMVNDVNAENVEMVQDRLENVMKNFTCIRNNYEVSNLAIEYANRMIRFYLCNNDDIMSSIIDVNNNVHILEQWVEIKDKHKELKEIIIETICSFLSNHMFINYSDIIENANLFIKRKVREYFIRKNEKEQ